MKTTIAIRDDLNDWHIINHGNSKKSFSLLVLLDELYQLYKEREFIIDYKKNSIYIDNEEAEIKD